MKIYFHGATGDVSGSAYHVETKHANVLMDCGLYQGGRETRENRARRTLTDLIRSRHGLKPEIPSLGDSLEI